MLKWLLLMYGYFFLNLILLLQGGRYFNFSKLFLKSVSKTKDVLVLFLEGVTIVNY